MNPVIIRAASPEDIPGILPLVAKTCAFHESLDPAKYPFKVDPQEMYRRWLTARSTDPLSAFFIAEQEGRVVGFIVGAVEDEIPIYRVQRYGFLYDLWVEKEHRHEGIARQLMLHAIDRFRRIGVPQMRLDVLAANEPAKKLFLSCGFRVSTHEMLMEL